MRQHSFNSSDVSAAVDGEPEHWLLRHKHRRHIARMKAGGGLGSAPMPEDAIGTRFKKSLRLPEAEKNITKSGEFSPKIGRIVTKTGWKGAAIRVLTLEERATCPRECENWRTCYGNNSPFARRLIHGGEFEFLLFCEMERFAGTGLVVRLHQLGDFYSAEYVNLWRQIIKRFGIRAFGYTAHHATSPIGSIIASVAAESWDKFAIRFLGRYQPNTVRRAITVKTISEADKAGAIVCPAQLGKTPNCGRCGLCWTADRTIAFLEH